MKPLGSVTQKVRSNTVLPGDKKGSIIYDPARQYYNRIKPTPIDVLDPVLKQQYLTELYETTNSTVDNESFDIGDRLKKKMITILE